MFRKYFHPGNPSKPRRVSMLWGRASSTCVTRALDRDGPVRDPQPATVSRPERRLIKLPPTRRDIRCRDAQGTKRILTAFEAKQISAVVFVLTPCFSNVNIPIPGAQLTLRLIFLVAMPLYSLSSLCNWRFERLFSFITWFSFSKPQIACYLGNCKWTMGFGD